MTSFPLAGSFEAFAYFGGQIPFDPSLPNERRTLQVFSPGYAGIFSAFTSTTNDDATFDLSPWLNPGETISSATMTLAVMNQDGTTDSTPNARQTSLVAITGPLISQRFGNFLPNIDYIQYRVLVTATTNQNNSIVFWGYLPVEAPVA